MTDFYDFMNYKGYNFLKKSWYKYIKKLYTGSRSNVGSSKKFSFEFIKN